MSEDYFRKLWPGEELNETDLTLSTYTGESVEVTGVCDVTVEYENKRYTLPLFTVEGNNRPSLFGRNWLRQIRVNWSSINLVRSNSNLRELLETYSDVFKDELGTFTGEKITISVHPSVTPKFCKSRTVPNAMKEKVERELRRLENDGIIEPVDYSEWAAPIVPVLKGDKVSVRICGDYKLTVNQASRVDQYPIPRIEDLFATLPGGTKFTKLDMSQAYQHLLLDDKSKNLVVVNTHMGLFRYNRLPFGVASAPGIFQRVMEGVLRGLSGVSVYLDDIIITAPTEADHLNTLKEVL
ncbi:hypothetical protein BSL78_16671 [Apostichopus japonicus]|uniref:Reverse transcriptase domain-containing protein n=1 Tax=Stichopus japonicus TaxID=307972 RepID=A0A2G8KEN7_STIJA|nr:hypothetical protein BSL78_16671 [Apostichopus japonicus]